MVVRSRGRRKVGRMVSGSARTTVGTVFVSAVLLGSVLGAGNAVAKVGGIQLAGEAHDDCTATISLTNFTNTTFYQPDWWFEQENDPALVNATTIPDDMPPPWREVNGIPWPMARWVGDPPLHSEVAEGVATWPGVPYNTNAQPDGFVSRATIALLETDGAPEPNEDGTMTIYFRVRSGPVTADRLPDPQQLVVTGCRKNGGGGSSGSANGSGNGSSGSGIGSASSGSGS